MSARVISPEEIIKSMQKTLKYTEKRGINSDLVFVPKKKRDKTNEQEYEVVIDRKNFRGLYQVKSENRTLRQHGSHVLAFAAYKRSFKWLLDDKTLAEACDLLNDSFHFDVMVGCFLNFLLGIKEENARSTPVYLSQAFDIANEEYDKITALKSKLPQSESELPQFVSSYLNSLLLLFHYFPTTTIHYGPAKDSEAGGRISSALDKLDEISKKILTYESTLEIKEAVHNLFDKKAIEHLGNEFKGSPFLLPCLMMQIYRIFYSFKYMRYLKRKSGDFSYFSDLALYCLHLDKEKSGSQILHASQIIDDLRALCKKKDPARKEIKKFSEAAFHLHALRNKYCK